jgi:hypothetical protein
MKIVIIADTDTGEVTMSRCESYELPPVTVREAWEARGEYRGALADMLGAEPDPALPQVTYGHPRWDEYVWAPPLNDVDD